MRFFYNFHYCNNYREAGVRCERELYNYSKLLFILYLLIMYSALCTDGKIQLAHGISNRHGNVHMCVNSTWSQLCGYGNSLVDSHLASVVCSELGYSPYGM